MEETKKDELIKNLETLLTEEKWTRATLNSYSVNNFKQLDEIIRQSIEMGIFADIKETSEEYLKHSKNSLVALYVMGIFSYEMQLIDDSHFIHLINIFMDNHKWSIVEYLAQKILIYRENKFAIKTLATVYENLNNQDELVNTWVRLVKIDYEEADIVNRLAHIREQDGNIEEAIDYYKKAIQRYITKKIYNQIEDIWHKLLQLMPLDVDFYLTLEKRISKIFTGQRSSELLNLLYEKCFDIGDWDNCIRILKQILDHVPDDKDTRNKLVDVYSEKYKDHSQLEEYIKISNLKQSWRSVHEAINTFEKHIVFDEGNFVFHRSWGIGYIRKIQKEMFSIDFIRKAGHSMSLKMALSSLQVLAEDHIWVLKLRDKDGLKRKILEDKSWALQIIIKGNNNQASSKEIKKELCPDILSQTEWTRWWNDARKIMKTDPIFGNLPDTPNVFVVRNKPISFEEKTYNNFKAQKDFNHRLEIIQDFVENSEPDNEYFDEMYRYFITFIGTLNNINENVIASYLLLKKIVQKYPFLEIQFPYSFKDYIDQVSSIEYLYYQINDTELKKDFLLNIRKSLEHWDEIYLSILKISPNKFILDELIGEKKWDKLELAINEIITRYKENREPFAWVCRNVLVQAWINNINLNKENIYFSLLHLIDISHREIEAKKNAPFNRKIRKQVNDFLFKENYLTEFIETSERETIERLLMILHEIKGLSKSQIVVIRHTVSEKYPDIQFDEAPANKVSDIFEKLIVTENSFNKKVKDFEYLRDVEIPNNSEEIGKAMEKGDLRENAEYKYALEKQGILTAQLNKLTDELQKAQIIKSEDIEGDTVTFGTTIHLKNLISNQEEQYTILGPWESDPENNTISYLSPFGSKLIDKKVNDKVKFVIDDKNYEYKLISVERADF